MNPELDLTLSQIIRAPRAAVWSAWTDPTSLAQWFLPLPYRCRVLQLDAVAGGALVTEMSDDGQNYTPHLNACFLVAEPHERLVFTNGLDSEWRPSSPPPVAITAVITLLTHTDGTEYRVVVRHGDRAARELHEELGFYDGWGTVTRQLASLVERSPQ